MKGRKSENSGFGIVVMDEKDQTLYEGGGIVRSDGNNFIPEIAAAAITLHALPNHLQADIFHRQPSDDFGDQRKATLRKKAN